MSMHPHRPRSAESSQYPEPSTEKQRITEVYNTRAEYLANWFNAEEVDTLLQEGSYPFAQELIFRIAAQMGGRGLRTEDIIALFKDMESNNSFPYDAIPGPSQPGEIAQKGQSSTEKVERWKNAIEVLLEYENNPEGLDAHTRSVIDNIVRALYAGTDDQLPQLSDLEKILLMFGKGLPPETNLTDVQIARLIGYTNMSSVTSKFRSTAQKLRSQTIAAKESSSNS